MQSMKEADPKVGSQRLTTTQELSDKFTANGFIAGNGNYGKSSASVVISSMLETLKQQGVTLLVISHDEEAQR